MVLAQTGTGLTAIGQVILDPVTGEIQAELVAGYAGRDPEMEEEIAAVQAQYEEQLSQVVGSTDVALVTTDPATGEYWVRSRETNLGDFCADAYRAVMGADIAFVNGGGIRAELAPGEVTYGDILDLHPYGNALCLVEATGQQILDALEMGARKYPQTSGGFLQVSGLTYTIDAAGPLLRSGGRERGLPVCGRPPPGDRCEGGRAAAGAGPGLYPGLPQLYAQKRRGRLHHVSGLHPAEG